MRILITGASGFLGNNLKIRLKELGVHDISIFNHHDDINYLQQLVNNAEFIFHLAGVNRSISDDEFRVGNIDFTSLVCNFISESGKQIPIVFSSSIQADLCNVYGVSKLSAENALLDLNKKTNNPIFIYRLTNIFGKWSKPNYNSVVATFCHNIARGLPITINNPNSILKLVYIDDVVENFIGLLNTYQEVSEQYMNVDVEYTTTVGKLAETINRFNDSIKSGITLPVGIGLNRALYATYLSFLPKEKFVYNLTKNEDARGTFVEMLKTHDSGQFSFFTAYPGITRGGHYHHTKTEKFLVIKGVALYRFRHIITDEYYEVTVSSQDVKVVETIPGWSHDITNIGEDELVVMLWANEIFDINKPDTIGFKVK